MYNFSLVLRVLIANRFSYIGDWEGRELRGRGGGGGNKPYREDQEALEMLPRCLDRQQGMVSREYWGESLQESVQVVKETKSWWVYSRLSNRRERHFPLSERLVQDRSWWANKMIEQKELQRQNLSPRTNLLFTGQFQASSSLFA